MRCATGGGRSWQLVGRAQFRRAFGIVVPGAKQLLNQKPSECTADDDDDDRDGLCHADHGDGKEDRTNKGQLGQFYSTHCKRFPRYGAPFPVSSTRNPKT